MPDDTPDVDDGLQPDDAPDAADSALDVPWDLIVCPLCPKPKGGAPKEPVKVKRGVKFCSNCRHVLCAADLRSMNVPEAFWKVTVPAATASVRPSLIEWTQNFERNMARGSGFYFFGPAGVGKTGAAVALLKHTRERFKTGYYVRVSEYREAKEHAGDYASDYVPNTTALAQAREADVLVLDAFSERDAALPYFKPEDLKELLCHRGDRQKVTFVTSMLAPQDLIHDRKDLWAHIEKYIPVLMVTGTNRERDERIALAEADAKARKKLELPVEPKPAAKPEKLPKYTETKTKGRR